MSKLSQLEHMHSSDVEYLLDFKTLDEACQRVTQQGIEKFRKKIDPLFNNLFDSLSNDDKTIIVAIDSLGEDWIQKILKMGKLPGIHELRDNINIYKNIIQEPTPSRIGR